MEIPSCKTTTISRLIEEETPTIQDEDNIIDEVTTTPYEKVLRILTKIKSFIISLNLKDNQMSTELDWVIKRISTHTLYTYDYYNDEEIEKYTEDNEEAKQFLEFLADFSESTQIKRRNNLTRANSIIINSGKDLQMELGLSTPSTNLKRKVGSLIPIRLGAIDIIEEEDDNHKEKKIEPKMMKLDTIKEQKYERSMTEDIAGRISSLDNNEEKKSKGLLTLGCIRQMVDQGIIDSDFKPRHSDNVTNIVIVEEKEVNVTEKIQSLNLSHDSMIEIVSKDFNIFEFEEKVGRSNVLPFIGKILFEVFSLSDMINLNKLDTLLNNISLGYNSNVPYHNCLHGADVAHTVGVFTLNSNLESIARTNVNDIISLISASLAHDLGHPGATNLFQMNSYSDMAINYNDQSVLENYHCAAFFRMSRRPECNIFDSFNDIDYKTLRKRIIGLILSTDMSQHAKILGVFKNKVQNYRLNGYKGEFIPLDSQTIFDEQQQVLDFILHTADLSHNSKSFNISSKWSYLLMEEFWQQGDREKQLGLPVSFLCDRTTADVPKSQIGFIRGIITPTFEVLCNLFPTLRYLMENIEKNVEEWGKISDLKLGIQSIENVSQTPRIFKRKIESLKNLIKIKNEGSLVPNNLSPSQKDIMYQGNQCVNGNINQSPKKRTLGIIGNEIIFK